MIRLEKCLFLLPDRKTGRGTIEIDNGTIANLELDESVEPEILVMPGLVNAHGHTAMTLLRGYGGGLPLKRWLEEAIFPVEAKMTTAHVFAGARWGAMEMLAGGTTAVADMYDFPADCERAFAETGIGSNTCRVGLNFVPGRLDECIGYVSRPSVDPKLQLRDFCVHSEYLTDEAFCRGMAEANRRLRRPVHLHLSETELEHRECLERHGMTPMRYLAGTGLLDHGGYAAHCVYCTDEDFELMRELKVTLVHNPTSNLKLGSGIARIRRAMELGVNVALGTDGCASNDDLDMFEEMRLASLLAKGVAKDPSALSAWDVIEMATVNGARALGRDDTGELAVGKRADLCVLDLKRLHLVPNLDAANLVVYCAHAADVIYTIVGGEIVYELGEFPRVDCNLAEREFRAAVGELFKGKE